MGKFEDLTGSQFGRWTVLEYVGNSKWKCKCSCEKGTIKIIHGYSLKSGRSQSCGCLRKEENLLSKIDDLTGKTFGNWEVLGYAGNSMWTCKCNCGCNTVKNVKGQSLKSGKSKSCGRNTTGFKDITGQKFGEWTVEEYLGDQTWKCRCSCGRTGNIETYNLIHGLSQSCGKHKQSSKLIDLTGQVFGELTVEKYLGGNRWLCRCSCGNKTIKLSHNLRRSDTIHCGCKDLKLEKEFILDEINKYTQEHGYKPFRRDLEDILDRGQSSVARYCAKYDLDKYLNKTFDSSAEKELFEIINNSNVIVHDKNTINGELDLLDKEAGLAIEYNGNRWHNDELKGKFYHRDKFIQCTKQNIQLISIFEYEWYDEDTKEKIKKLIDRKYNRFSTKLYARKLEIKHVDKNEASEFINKYHLQKDAVSSIRIGLYNGDELVQIMTFGKPRFNTEYQYEIIRLCTKDDTIVVGGAEKIFKYFIKNYKPQSVISYCNLSKFTGTLYTKLGFKLSHVTEPGYVWWKNGVNVMSRYETQKHKLVKLGLGEESQTEDEIMRSLGYTKIHDCGQAVFVYK